uniref:FAD/NAD(P)-binding domain-containing protein n=1 Tax=Ditylum brightwellii TaxID=49249 RepID=A0A7S4VR67_9STRA|mmetsp:Transcript_22248/g.29636  ORF Transcript_22248/g.29636 Transcript_22248/m.29636 type:complete len:526 (+) Transcript_22248:113-1690(+)
MVRRLLSTWIAISLTQCNHVYCFKSIIPFNRSLHFKRCCTFTSIRKTTTMTATSSPSTTPRKLVLVGGGHAHVQVLKSLHKFIRPSNLSVTLIDAQSDASYSGMVPGCVSKLYTPDETLIRLKPLTTWAGIEFVQGTVVDVNLDSKVLNVKKEGGEDEVEFDVVCFDIGSTSRGLVDTIGALEYTIPTRPISNLITRIEEAEILLRQSGEKDANVVVVGGGAAGIELALAMRARWNDLGDVSVTLLDSGTELVPSENKRCRQALLSVLDDHDITIQHSSMVSHITSSHIHLQNEKVLPYTHCIWAAGASSHDLADVTMRKRGLAVDDRGWIAVNESLQSISHPFVFAAGDCATMVGLPKGKSSPPKAGVYAVRSGPILIENLTKMIGSLDDNSEANNKLTQYEPQGDFLKLIMCGDGTALGFRFGLPLRGKWVWHLKDKIDTMFMELFAKENLPDIKEGEAYDTSQYDAIVNRPKPLEVEEAGRLLMRTDDEVEYEQAWNVLRDMMADDDYQKHVLKLIEMSQGE